MRTCVPEVSIKGRDKLSHATVSVGCNYLSLPLMPVSGRRVLKYEGMLINNLSLRLVYIFLNNNSSDTAMICCVRKYKVLREFSLKVHLCYLLITTFHWLILMGLCLKDVTPLLTHWSCIFLALTHRYNVQAPKRQHAFVVTNDNPVHLCILQHYACSYSLLYSKENVAWM